MLATNVKDDVMPSDAEKGHMWLLNVNSTSSLAEVDWRPVHMRTMITTCTCTTRLVTKINDKVP